MATKTTKKKGETSTTVSVGIRIDPKIKFALDIMGRMQKRSLTAVIEWAISNAISQQLVDTPDGERAVASVIERVWSTDECTRFVLTCLEMPTALTYDERRVWDTIKLSTDFWRISDANSYKDEPALLEWLLMDELRKHWADLNEHVEQHKASPSVVPYDTIPF